MSVTTRSDEKREQAKEHLRKAQECLFEALSPDTWGSEDYSKEYTLTMEEALITLMQLRKKL